LSFQKGWLGLPAVMSVWIVVEIKGIRHGLTNAFFASSPFILLSVKDAQVNGEKVNPAGIS
jgi:hypothetical protein